MEIVFFNGAGGFDLWVINKHLDVLYRDRLIGHPATVVACLQLAELE